MKKSKKFGTKIVTSAKVRVGLHGVQKTKYVGLVAVQKNVLLKLLLRLVQKDELQHKSKEMKKKLSV